MAMGASSGGHFCSVLAANMRFCSITLMIAQGMFDQMDVSKDYPPTPFVHMPKDRLDQAISVKLFELLHEKGFIDENGYMRSDGRATCWKEAIREKAFLPDKYE
ncbi:hypothetical protein HHK36_023461 [Tetracentron sinense]|uniref:Uncharacterized protein n=1 Tax=Tetracentron sinense TaxID=13715 RepID=A0A834YNA1_TETSI|nr:hypothetical protein HHK36_023461 [Tetracentron sinense]